MNTAEAIRLMGLPPDDEESERYFATIRGTSVKHWTGGVPIVVEALRDDAYVTVARFAKGTRRTAENCVAVDALFFDCDLKQYLSRPDTEVYGLSEADLDRYLTALMQDAQEAFNRASIPIHRIIGSGYGIHLYSLLAPLDRGRVDAINVLHGKLVERVNRTFGGTLVDPGAGGIRARLSRLVGSANHKGPKARPVSVLWEQDGTASLADFPDDLFAAPVRSVHQAVDEHPLSQEALDEITIALSGEYQDGFRNLISLSVPALLAKQGVPDAQILSIIETISQDDDDPGKALSNAQRTLDKFHAGGTVSGYHSLSTCLSRGTRDFIADAARRDKQGGFTVTPISDVAPVAGPTKLPWGNVYEPPPEECYYGWFGDHVRMMASATHGAPQWQFVSALIYAGMALGRKACLYQVGNQHPNLMAVIVGDTGTAKDTAANFARDLFKLQDELARDESEQRDYIVLGRLSTMEGILQDMHSKGRSKLLIHNSEFNSIIEKSRRETGGGVLPLLMTAYDSPDQFDLPTRKDPLFVENPFLSMISTITPQVLSETCDIKDITSGFTNRVLWVMGNKFTYMPNPPRADKQAQLDMMRVFLANVKQATANDMEFQLSPQANALFNEAGEQWEKRTYWNDGEKHLSMRLIPNAKRIALIFAASDGDKVITEEMASAACTFMAWQFEHIAREVRMWGANDAARLEQLIIATLRRQPLSAYDLYSKFAHWGSSTLDRAVKGLQGFDRIFNKPSDGLYYAASEPLGVVA
jgi:hypothetical protein